MEGQQTGSVGLGGYAASVQGKGQPCSKQGKTSENKEAKSLISRTMSLASNYFRVSFETSVTVDTIIFRYI